MLYIEDDSAAGMLFQIVAQELKPLASIQIADNARHALAFLRQEAPFAAALRPDLVVIDIHMPGMDGLSLLEHLREDVRFVALPVVMFSSSVNTADPERARRFGALAFIYKPHNLPDFEQAVREILSLLSVD